MATSAAMAKGFLEDLAKFAFDEDKRLREERAIWDPLFQEISRLVIPRKATFTESTETAGLERNRHVLDSTAPRALELFAAFISSTMTNPSTEWLKLMVKGDRELNKQQAVKEHLEVMNRITMDELASETTNVYPHLHSTYFDLGSFGQGVLHSGDSDGELRYRNFHLADCVWDTAEDGRPDTMYRQFQFTPRKAEQRWDMEALHPDMQRLLREHSKRVNQETRWLHVAVPTTDRATAALMSPGVREQTGNWFEYYVDIKNKHVIAPIVDDTFTYHIPRWYVERNEKMGRSPAMTVLPDIRMVNRMKATLLRGAEKLVDPPLVMRDGALMSPVRLFPGGITFTEGDVTPQPLIPPGASRIEIGERLIERSQDIIREGFFVPLFLTESTPVKTATQVLQESGERNRAVSPMLIRLQAEFYHPLIRRAVTKLDQQGKYPEMPAELQGVELEIEYQSPLVGAAREMEGLAMLRFFELIGPLAGVDPGVFDLIDSDEYTKTAHSAAGAPAKILRKTAAVKKLRAARAAQQQQEQALQQAQVTADSTAKLLKAGASGQAQPV